VAWVAFSAAIADANDAAGALIGPRSAAQPKQQAASSKQRILSYVLQ